MKKKTVFVLLFSLFTIVIFAQEAISIRVATFNLRMDTPEDGLNAWKHRKEMVKGLIRFHDFDIMGTQEGFRHQLNDILELENYECVGVGRDDGKIAGEHSAIFFKKNRFDVLVKGDFWFSETPQTPSKGWDATCCNRICSWAKFRDKESGKLFFVFNVHYDHEGHLARKSSSLLLLRQIQQIAGNAPVFCTGDFNATPDQEPIRIIRESEKLKDSYLISQESPYGTEGTFNGFKTDSSMKNRIDYIWVAGDIAVKKYGTLNDMPYTRFPSDHFPVVIQAQF